MRALVLSVLLALVVGAAGCGSACQELADRICNCQPAGSLRDSCKSSVSNQIGGSGQRPGETDQKHCEELLKTCPDPASDSHRCEVLQTEEGKVACGLAYSPTPGS